MRTLLTGGTGFLGSHVARALRGAGHDVLALVRDRARGRDLELLGCELLEGDLIDVPGWAHALKDVDALAHTAALVQSWGPSPETFDRINVDACLDLLDRARSAHLTRVTVTSSLFALGPSPGGDPRDESALDAPPDPLMNANDYVRTKARVARAIAERQRDGDPVILLFPTVLFGEGPRTRGNHTARILEDLRDGTFPGLVGDGEQVWNVVPVSRAATGHLAALERGPVGGRFILGGENWTQRRFVERASLALNVKPPLRRLGRALPMIGATAFELLSRLTGKPPRLTRGEIALYDAHWAFTSERARVELGYSAGDVEAALRETAAWIRGDDR